MSSLDSLLAEVGPILSSSQFTHPSYREILAARQFANEINSGKLSARDAYEKTISHDCCFIQPTFIPVMHHMVELLNEEDALKLVYFISSFTDYCSKKDDQFISNFLSFTNRLYDCMMEDLVICAKFIGKYHWNRTQDNRAKDILGLLAKVYHAIASVDSFEDKDDYLYDRSERAWYALEKADFNLAVRHYRARSSLSFVHSVLEFSESEPDQLRNFLIKSRDIGVDVSLDDLIEGLHTFSQEGPLECMPVYLSGVLEFIRAHGLKNEDVRRFNDCLEEYANVERLMDIYSSSLDKFAKKLLKKSGIELYYFLDERRGIQFFNSEVYKPK